MKTKSILLLMLIASAMIQVFVHFCIWVFVCVLILAIIQDQALVASKHFLVETENKNLVDNAEGPPEAKLKSLPDQTVGNDYLFEGWQNWPWGGLALAKAIGAAKLAKLAKLANLFRPRPRGKK